MSFNKQVIYLDNNASTPVDKHVLDAMMPFLTTEFANASSPHIFGVRAHSAVKLARKWVAELIVADPQEIIFTSGATEAINLAIKGVAENYQSKGKHIVTVTTEHSAVLDTCRYLETKGYEVTYLPVQADGLVELEVLKSALRTDTILVSVMHVNNETGVLQPIKEIADLTHNVGAVFMSDCTQAVGKIPIDVDKLGIDLLCMSGHKIYAPKGIGALFIRHRNRKIKIPALIHGGGHERGIRSGTLNVPGIVALGAACELAQKELFSNAVTIKELRDYLETELLKIDGTSVNGNKKKRLYNVSNIVFQGVDSDAMIMGLSNTALDRPLIAVSSGSACTSGLIEPSYVLTAMGLDKVSAFNSIRFSFGKYNTKKEIDIAIAAVENVLKILKAMVT
jgi:cysteine desulfurase